MIGEAPGLVYSDYAVFLSGIALAVSSVHAWSLRASGARTRAWGALVAGFALLAFAHVFEVLRIAGAGGLAIDLAWATALVASALAFVPFVRSGDGAVSQTLGSSGRVALAYLVPPVAVVGAAAAGWSVPVAAAGTLVVVVAVSWTLWDSVDEEEDGRRMRGAAVLLVLFAVGYATGTFLLWGGAGRLVFDLVAAVRAVCAGAAMLLLGGYVVRASAHGIPVHMERSFRAVRAALAIVLLVAMALGAIVTVRSEYSGVGLALGFVTCALIIGFYAQLQMTRAAAVTVAESERRFRRIFEHAPEVILMLDCDTGRIVDVNSYAPILLGYSAEELSSMHLRDLIRAADYGAPVPTFAPGSCESHAVALRSGDGADLEVELTSVGVEYQHCDATMVFVRDVTQRNRSARALAEQVEFNALITDISRSFIDATADTVDTRIERALGRIGIYSEVDRAYVFEVVEGGRMVNTNEWCDQGVPGRKWLFRSVPVAMYPSITARLLGGRNVYIPDVERAEGLTTTERSSLAAGGIRSLLALPTTVGGHTVGFMAFATMDEAKEWSAETIPLLQIVADIVATARSKARAELDLRKVSRAVEQSPVAVMITDADGAIEYVNPRYSEITGFSADEVLGRNPRILKSGLTPPDVYEDLWNTVLSGEVWHGEFVNRRKSGEAYWASVTVSAVRREDGTITHFVEVQEDVTEQKEAAEALSEAKAQAESANRAKSEFLATMSHEIRTPMNAIIGMAELLRETELTVQQARYVDIFQRAGESLLELINAVLDLSKIEADRLDLERVNFSLRDVVETAGAVTGTRASDKGLELLYRIAPDVPPAVVGDPTRLRQVLMNLLGNAVKFTEEGGQVLLTVERDPDAGSDGGVLFTVADTGIGIPADKVDQIFESFSQADSSTTRKFGGTGLGLTISKRIIEMMGGTVRVESVEGEGTTFLVSIPFPLAPEGARVEEDEARTAELTGRRVLIVDDNDTNRLIVAEAAAAWKMKAEEATGAEEALGLVHAAAAEGRPFDAIVLDHQMPDVDGLDFAEGLRGSEVGADARIVMVSSDVRDRDVERIKALELVDYLLKPVRREELRQSLIAAVSAGKAAGATSPAARTGSTPGTAAPEQGAEPHAARILLVEDNEDNRFLIERYLKGTPHSVDVAVDGAEAVEAVTSAEEPYDLVLMDMQMPVMDGYEATRRIRAWEQDNGLEHRTIVALTAHALSEEVERTAAAGCDGHLTKPIKKQVLLEAIERYTKGVGHDG